MIYVIPEGQTEEKVINKLLPAKFERTILRGEGKSKITSKLEGLIANHHLNQLSCLILRDLDSGEEKSGIRQSIETTVQKTLQKYEYSYSKIALEPLPGHENVFTFALDKPNIRLALHIAHPLNQPRWPQTFTQTTIDDYVLDLSLHYETVERLIEKNGHGWAKVKPEEIVRKVTEEIPALLQANQIPLQEAKDYVRLYAAIMQLHTSPPVFAEKVLGNAPDTQVTHIFASLRAAVSFLGGYSHVF